MMRWAVAAVALLPLLSGCLGLFEDDPERRVEPTDVGYDASTATVARIDVHQVTIPMADGVELAAVIHEPIVPKALEDGSAMPLPVVLLFHEYGQAKELLQAVPLYTENPIPLPPVNLLEKFAAAGFITVAYDQRGHGRSGGTTSFGGPAEMSDVDTVLDWVDERFLTNGFVGAAGHAYGGGMSLNLWAANDRITTAAVHDGWADLYDALAPGNVPKLAWLAGLEAVGSAGTQARMDDDIHQWFQKALLRTDMDSVESQMDARSVLDAGAWVDKPLLVCQGLQDSVSGNVDMVWEHTRGYWHAHYYTGGHLAQDGECWDKTVDWFKFFLAGIDTQVDKWPRILAVDHTDDEPTVYPDVPPVRRDTFFMRDGDLTLFQAENASFTVSQNLLANPFHEPNVIYDVTPLPYQEVPAQMRQDPTAVFFATPRFDETEVILGAPEMWLQATNETRDGPFQVVATLYHQADGSWRLLGRSAYAVLNEGDHDNGVVHLRFPWLHAPIHPEGQIILKLGGNDPTAFAPLMANYSVTFTGASTIVFPFFDPPEREV